MTPTRLLGGVFLVSAFAFGATRAMADDNSQARPLIQADFSRLVPTNYPVKTTQFSRLKPTAYPVLQRGTPTVHITEKVVQTTGYPLLRTN
jgi:hypothetical protein